VARSATARKTRASRRKRARPEPRSRRDWFALVGKAATAVGLVGAIVGLVFTFWPDAKPHESPGELSGKLSGLDVTPDITFRQYLQRIDREPGGLDGRTLGRHGAFVEFEIGATGYKGDKLRLRSQLLDVATGDRVVQDQATTVKPEATHDTIAWQTFLPFPSESRGPFEARIVLLDPDGTPLSRARSKPFSRRAGGG
jgi:hypothetical protein